MTFLLAIDGLAYDLGNALNIPQDQILLVLVLIFAFIMGIIFNIFKNSFIRYSYSLILGIFCQYLVFRFEMIHMCTSSLITYLIVKILPNQRKLAAILVTVIMLGYLSWYHIYRMIYDYGGWRMDLSFVFMMTLPKYCSFAWCYKDGNEPNVLLSADQYERRIIQLPNLFKYLSYIFFFGSSLLGPAFDYIEYEQFIELKEHYSKLPRSYFPGFKKFLQGIIMILIISYAPPIADPKSMWKSEYIIRPLYEKIGLYCIAGFLFRARFYAGWFLTTSTCIITGLSYNGKDQKGKDKWDKVVSVKALAFELSTSPKVRIEHWNYSVQAWLRRYIFYRVASEQEIKKDPKKAAFAANITFMVSAFWHGFYPLYYISFLELFLVQQQAKTLYNWRHKFSFMSAPLQTIICWLLCTISVNYLLVSFTILDLSQAHIFRKSVYYFPTVILIFGYITSIIVGYPKKEGSKKKVENEKID